VGDIHAPLGRAERGASAAETGRTGVIFSNDAIAGGYSTLRSKVGRRSKSLTVRPHKIVTQSGLVGHGATRLSP